MRRLLPLPLLFALLLTLTAHVTGSRAGVSVVLNGEMTAVPAYTEDGRTIVPLRDIAEALGLAVVWDEETRTAYLSDGAEAAALSAYTVVLDPGHGGGATGAQYEGVRESALNLSIAQKTAAALRREGVGVVMTRTGDSDLSLYARTDLAQRRKADLFVSIHCNVSTTNPDARGIYTAYHPQSDESRLLADTLQSAVMAAADAPNMGVEERPDLAVLRTAAMPAALVECGFMSTPAELALLRSEAYQQRIAQGIADGILSHLRGGN